MHLAAFLVAATTETPSIVLWTFIVSFISGFLAAIGFFMLRGWLPLSMNRVTTKAQELSSFVSTGEPVKMTLVVRKDLKMGTGKIAAQCAHAAVATVEEILALKDTATAGSGKHPWVQWYEAWHISGCSKIALRCDDEAAMMAVASMAKSKSIPYYVIRDAGRTQIAAGSKTVVAVGPAPASIVDAVTGHLKLL